MKCSFITFDSEIGYEECLKMKDFKFGEDILRVEPGQDKGSIPTSVLDTLSFQLDHLGCFEHSQNNYRRGV